jgi:CheY-like chemotaxis protein
MIERAGVGAWRCTIAGDGLACKAALIRPAVYLSGVIARSNGDANVPDVMTAYGRARTILIIEDNEDNRAIYGTMLRSRGFVVLESEDGERGVAMARAELPHLVVMDIGLPRMDGVEATRQLRAEPSTIAIPILALTAHALRDERERAMRAGVDGYLVKPVSNTVLVETVERILRDAQPDPDRHISA